MAAGNLSEVSVYHGADQLVNALALSHFDVTEGPCE